MRLVISDFSPGLISEQVVSRMGLGGLSDGGANEVRIIRCPATEVNAIEFQPRLAFSKLGGREQLHTVPWHNAAIIRLYQWYSDLGHTKALVFSCASGSLAADIATVQREDGNMVFTSIKPTTGPLSAWNPHLIEDNIDVCTYGSSAIMTYGDSELPLAVYSGGSTIAPLTGTNMPLGAKTVAAWGSYLFVGNIIDESIRRSSRLRWCQILQPTVWPVESYIDLDPDDGDEISAMWVVRNVLVVFKRRKIFVVKYVGGALEFDWERVDSTMGCVGPNAVVEIEGELYFISYTGFCKFDGVRAPTHIDDTIINIVKLWHMDGLAAAECDYYDNDQVFFSVPESIEPYKNKVYIYDIDNHNWSAWLVPNSCFGNIVYGTGDKFIDFPLPYRDYNFRISAMGGDKASYFTLGSYDGYLARYGTSLDDLGEPLHAYWISPWIDFGFSDYNKRILRIYVYADRAIEPMPITFDGYVDWNDSVSAVTQTFDVYEDSFKETVERRLDFTLPCRAFKFKISTSIPRAQVTIHKIVVDFLVKGRTITS